MPGERLHAQVVHGEELRQPLRIARRQAREPVPDPLAQRVPDRGEGLVRVQRLPRGGGPQAVRVDDAPHEERPLGQQLVRPVRQQHALEMHPVSGALRRTDGGRQDMGDPADPGERQIEIDRVERREAEELVAVARQRPPPARRARVRPVPRRRQIGDGRLADPYVVGQQRTEVPGQREHPFPGEPLGAAGPGRQVHGGAGLGTRAVGERDDGVRTVVTGAPLHRRGAGSPRGAAHHPDLRRDDEAGQQSDTELPEEVRPRRGQPLRPVALGAAADRGEQAVHIRLGQTDATVLDAQPAVLGVQPHQSGRVRLLGTPGRDGVHGVLQQLAQIDTGRGVEVMGEKVDQSAQIHLEGVRLLAGGGLGGRGIR